ncbi:MAG TPA: hypothetical protein VNT32_04615 [Thermoleophilaceae bacterium]|nr:hypothetical protein [Thermoleophilaceae bacterium]
MEYALALVLLVAAVALVVSRPLRTAEAEEREHAGLRRELEAAKEAKYREIRDAELDRRTGKLAEADWRRIDRELRAEAVEILRRIDELD